MLDEKDLQTVFGWLSPEYLLQCSKEHGIKVASSMICHPYDGTASQDKIENLLELILTNPRILHVFGALDAYKEVRSQIRNYIRWVRVRDGIKTRDIQLALHLRIAGYVGNVQPLTLLDGISSWRKIASKLWADGSGTIPGEVEILVEGASQKDVDAAVIKAVAEALFLNDSLNKALLQGALWQRHTPHVMVNLAPERESVKSLILDPVNLSLKDIRKRIWKSVRAFIKMKDSPLKSLSDVLWESWLEWGLIHSPAGAMISCVGSKGVYKGFSSLLTNFNGIPAAFTVGQVRNSRVWVSGNFDHRVFDADHCGKFYRFLEKRVPELLGGDR